eukprot:3941610-Rhodomonas_salina.2
MRADGSKLALLSTFTVYRQVYSSSDTTQALSERDPDLGFHTQAQRLRYQRQENSGPACARFTQVMPAIRPRVSICPRVDGIPDGSLAKDNVCALPRRKQTDLKAETGQANAGQRRPRSGWRAKANIASLWLPKAYDPSTECGIAGDDVVELCFERDGVLQRPSHARVRVHTRRCEGLDTAAAMPAPRIALSAAGQHALSPYRTSHSSTGQPTLCQSYARTGNRIAVPASLRYASIGHRIAVLASLRYASAMPVPEIA